VDQQQHQSNQQQPSYLFQKKQFPQGKNMKGKKKQNSGDLNP
jgi:hypothetical protein